MSLGSETVDIARKFEFFLQAYRRPDGRRWTGQEIDEATGGIVSRSYVTNLQKGRIENPGYEKLRAIAQALSFPPGLWFEENLDGGKEIESERGSHGIDKKLSHLFEIMRSGTNGKAYTDAEVARLSSGELTEEDVEAIRTGKRPDPPVDQIVALSDVFAVHPSYLLDRTKHWPPFDGESMEIFRDETVSAIARKSLRLPNRDRQLVLNIIRQFEQMQEVYDKV
jgi:transcriptional regulator with XRE-family HTH domain